MLPRPCQSLTSYLQRTPKMQLSFRQLGKNNSNIHTELMLQIKLQKKKIKEKEQSCERVIKKDNYPFTSVQTERLRWSIQTANIHVYNGKEPKPRMFVSNNPLTVRGGLRGIRPDCYSARRSSQRWSSRLYALKISQLLVLPGDFSFKTARLY